MSYPNKDDGIRYPPPQSSERPRPMMARNWDLSGGSGGVDRRLSSSTQSSYADSSVPGEAVEAHSTGANGVLLTQQNQYGVLPHGGDRQMFPLLAKKFEEAVEQNEELQSEIERLKQCCNTYIGQADQAVKDMKARHQTQLKRKETRVSEMRKLYEDTLKQYEDAKIVVLSYKSRNIELEGHIRGLTAQLEEPEKVVQRGAAGSPRELERLRRELAELKSDYQACIVGLECKDEDLKEMRDKRDRFKQSYQQAADERDRLAAEVAQLQRRLVELDSNSHKKDLSALRMRLQESQVSNSELQEHVKDLQQQLASASTGSLLQQQEAEGLTAALETRHEQDMMKQMTQMNEWRARCQQLEEQVQSTREEVETLRSNKYELLTTMDGLKKAMDNKEEQIRDLLAVKSALEQQRVAPPRPSDREADLLTRLQAEEDRVKELTRQLNSAEDRERRLEVENVHLKRDARKVDLQSPTSPTAPANLAQIKQMNQLLDQMEAARKRERELEQECAHLRQARAEASKEMSWSREHATGLQQQLDASEDEVADLRKQIQMKDTEKDFLESELSAERESKQHLQHTHHQERQQLESRVEQTEVRFKDYRRELKEHAQALAKVGQELQVERANKDRVKVELDQELRSREKAWRDLKEEQNTANLLREQLRQYVSDFQMEKQGHQRTAQDKRALEQRVRDLEKELRKIKQDYDSRQPHQQLGHLYKVDSQEEPPRGGRSDQFTEYARPAPPMYQTSSRPGTAAQVPKAGGIQPPGVGARRDPTGASQSNIHPLSQGGGVQDPRGTAGEDAAARRHPCPICGRTFPDLQKLERHAANCNGN